MKLYCSWFSLAIEPAAGPVPGPLTITGFKTGAAPWWCGNVGPLAFAFVWWRKDPGARPPGMRNPIAAALARVFPAPPDPSKHYNTRAGW